MSRAGCANLAAMEPRYHVVQIEDGLRNDLGEMAEMKLYSHLKVRLGLDMDEAETVLADLEKNPSATVYSTDGRIRLEVKRLNTRE